MHLEADHLLPHLDRRAVVVGCFAVGDTAGGYELIPLRESVTDVAVKGQAGVDTAGASSWGHALHGAHHSDASALCIAFWLDLRHYNAACVLVLFQHDAQGLFQADCVS